MTIRSKIILSMIAVSLMVVIISGMSVFASKEIQGHFKAVTETISPAIRALEKVQYAGLRILNTIHEVGFINAELRNLDSSSKAADLFGELSIEHGDLKRNHQLLEAALEQFQKHASKDPNYQNTIVDITLACWQLFGLSDDLFLRIQKGERGESLLNIEEEFDRAEQEFIDILAKALLFEKEREDIQSEHVSEHLTLNLYVAIAASMLTVIAVVVFGTYMTRSILKPLDVLYKATNDVGRGRLDVALPEENNDEYGKAFRVFNNMVQRINSLTQSLTKEKEVAEKASEAKSRFLATMSHEIRTPMNGVLGMLHLLKKTNMDHHQQQLINTAMGSGNLLLTVINDILDFSKIEADKLTLESIHFDPSVLVEEVVTMMAESANSKNLELIYSVGENLPCSVKGDPVRLKQVLVNLAGNAVKFTEHGQVELFLRLTDDEKHLELGVGDTGIGMDGAQQKLVFSAFNQADNSTTRKYGGTGLGLAISRQLVRKMGGELKLSSALHEGSIFSFCLPLENMDPQFEVLPEVVDEKMSALPEMENELALRKYEGRRVLLVEDVEINQMVAEDLLVDIGLRVDIVSNGQEALQTIQENSYDIVLMDIQMPVMDGLEATRQIRQLGGHYGEMPIIAMTAHAMKEDIDKSLASGMNDHVTKPILPEQLNAAIARWL